MIMMHCIALQNNNLAKTKMRIDLELLGQWMRCGALVPVIPVLDIGTQFTRSLKTNTGFIGIWNVI